MSFFVKHTFQSSPNSVILTFFFLFPFFFLLKLPAHHIMRHVANYIPASIRWSLLEHAEGFCDYALTDYDLISMSKINVATAAVLCGLNNIGRKNEDEYWVSRCSTKKRSKKKKNK